MGRRLAILTASACLAGTAHAATITPTTATAPSQFPGYEAPFAIDTGGNRFVTDFAAQGTGAGSTITFGLGGSFTLGSALITDRTTSGGRNGGFVGGISDFTTRYRLDFANDPSFGTILGSYTSPVLTVPVGPTTVASFQTSPTFASPITAQFVRYTVLAAQGGNPGLADIQFNTVRTPSPGSLALAALGLMGLGLVRRRG
jgi:hypothetical protein